MIEMFGQVISETMPFAGHQLEGLFIFVYGLGTSIVI